MDYKTMDWDAEAKRVRRAFNIKEPFSIVYLPSEEPPYDYLDCWRNDVVDARTCDNHIFNVEYDDSAIYFEFFIHQNLCVDLTWKGKLIRVSGDLNNALPMAKGLFHLDLLTPEIEAALMVNISAHERLEWTREYEARYGLPEPN